MFDSFAADNRFDFFFRIRFAQGVTYGALAECAAYLGQGPQMVSARRFRSQQHENQVARAIINRFEIDAVDQSQIAADRCVDALKTGVRDGNASARASASA